MAPQIVVAIRLLRVYFAGNEDDDEAACPALAWINFSTAATTTSISWTCGFFACSTTASCWATQAAGAGFAAVEIVERGQARGTES